MFINGQIPNNDFIKDNAIMLMQAAAERFEQAIINGCLQNGEAIEIVSVPFIGSFPKRFKKMMIPTFNIDNHLYLGFNNLWGYRNISRFRQLKKYLKKNLKNFENKKILLYSPHTPFVKLAKYIKKYCDNTEIVLIVPDLPQYMNLEKKKSFMYRIMKKIDIKVLNSNLKYIDKFIFLTEQMNEIINPYKKPYLIVEGIASLTPSNEFKELQHSKKKIVYTGKTNLSFGISTLIDAFNLIKDDNVELHIYGTGDGDSYLKTCSQQNAKIYFHGMLPSSEMFDIIQDADILVNPRDNHDDYTKYSFPSKLMDYIATGRPVVCFHLNGIPKEYDSVLIYPKEENATELAKTLNQVLNYSKENLQKIFITSKKFILQKTPKEVFHKIDFFAYNGEK